MEASSVIMLSLQPYVISLSIHALTTSHLFLCTQAADVLQTLFVVLNLSGVAVACMGALAWAHGAHACR